MTSRHRAVVLTILTLLTTACGPFAPGAEELRFRSGGDVVVAASDALVSETVDGDVMAGGRSIRLTGEAGGSYLGAGQVQEIRGSVAGSVRAVGGALSLSGPVGRNVTALGADVVLEPAGEVTLNAYLIGGRVVQRGRVGGHLRVAARDVVLDGPVEGNVEVVSGTFTLGPSAVILGDLTYRVREGQATLAPTAQVQGTVTEITVPEPSRAHAVLFAAGRLAAFLLVGAVLLLVLPPVARTLPQLDARPLAAFGHGLLWLIAIPVFVFAAAVTVFGIPLAVISATLALIGLYVAPVVPSLWLGSALLDRPGAPPTPRVRAFLLGGVLVGTVLLLPWIGPLARLVATALGFGSVVLAVRAGMAVREPGGDAPPEDLTPH